MARDDGAAAALDSACSDPAVEAEGGGARGQEDSGSTVRGTWSDLGGGAEEDVRGSLAVIQAYSGLGDGGGCLRGSGTHKERWMDFKSKEAPA